MEIKLIQKSKTTDITGAVAKAEWSGAMLSAGRTLSFDYLNAPLDKTLVIPKIASGDCVSLLEDGTELFFGQILGVSRSSEIGTLAFTAYDIMKNVLGSEGRYNFKNMTPEAIARQVLRDLQIPIGDLAATGINIKSLIVKGKSYYDIIMAAYTKAHKINGKCYQAEIKDRKFCVTDITSLTVSGFSLSDEVNLTSASIEESIDDMANRVRIYDKTGKQIGEVKTDSSIDLYGVYQKVYEKEDGVNPTTGAKALMKATPKQTITVKAIGSTKCISGRKVKVEDKSTGLSASYWITSDKHTWETGVQTMELDLQYDKLMDEKDSDS